MIEIDPLQGERLINKDNQREYKGKQGHWSELLVWPYIRLQLDRTNDCHRNIYLSYYHI